MRRMVKMASSKARGDKKPEVIFTILLAEEGHDGETNKKIINRMGQNAWQQTSGFLIDPCPEQATPTDAQ